MQSLPNGTSSSASVVSDTALEQSPTRKTGAVVAQDKQQRYSSNIFIKHTKRLRGQSQGKSVIKLPNTGRMVLLGQGYDVSDRESNNVRDITIDTLPYEYKNLNSHALSGLLAYLLRGSRTVQRTSSSSESDGPACAPEDVFVNYVYECDIRNQVFNSSFHDPNSIVIQNLQSCIADWTAEEIYKRNLVLYVTDDACLIKIIDVSKQYDGRATLRFYISINVSKNLIPVIRRVLAGVCDKLQNERFATSNQKIDWGNMLLIPIQK